MDPRKKNPQLLNDLKKRLKNNDNAPASEEEEETSLRSSPTDSEAFLPRRNLNREAVASNVLSPPSSSVVRKPSSLSRQPSYLRGSRPDFAGKRSISQDAPSVVKLTPLKHSVTFPGKRSIERKAEDKEEATLSPPLVAMKKMTENVNKQPTPAPRRFAKNPSRDEPKRTEIPEVQRNQSKVTITDSSSVKIKHSLTSQRDEEKRKFRAEAVGRSSFMFKKTNDSADISADYNTYIFANYTFLLATDDSVDDFQIWSNDEAFGVFDKIILEVEANRRREMYAIHSVVSKTELSAETLSKPEGDFSLKQCFDSFQNLEEEFSDFNLVLLTPQPFIDYDEKVTIEEEIKVEVVPTHQPSLHHKCCYKCVIVTEGIKESSSDVIDKCLAYRNFFNKFVIWCEYPPLATLKNRLKTEMKKRCVYDNIAEKYLKFVTNWIGKEGLVEMLTKSSILRLLVLYVVEPIMEPLVLGAVSNNALLLQEVISAFTVTVFDENLLVEVAELWGDVEEELDDEEAVKMLNDQFLICRDVTEMNDMEKTKLLWMMGKSPLILKDHLRCRTAIGLFKDETYIVLGRGEHLPDECSVFRQLSDFDTDEEVYEELTTSFKYCLEGEELSLSTLIGPPACFEKIITPSDLVQMVSAPYTITSKKEDLPTPYIPRLVSRNVVDHKYLETMDSETLVLISSVTNRKKIENSAKRGCQYSLDQKNPTFNLWIVDKECSEDDFDKLCRLNKTKRRYHHFREVDGHLEWLKTLGDIQDVEPYCLDGHFAEESSLMSFDNKINIIVDEAGKGKSVALKRLTTELPHFTVYLCSSEISGLCHGGLNEDKLKQFIISTKYPNMTSFDKFLLLRLFDKHQVVFLWDGLDEISTKNFEVVAGFINELKESIHFIACRQHLKSAIENKLCALSRYLAHFNPEEMKQYIEGRLRVAFQDDFEKKFNKLNNVLSRLQLDNFLKVPIQLFMLTELVIKNVNLLDELYSVGDLYKHFVDEKLNQSYKDNSVPYDNDYSFRKEQIEKYQEAALVVLFDDEVLIQLGVDPKKFTNRRSIDNFGFFSYTDGKPHFFHYSYAEYFVATYFVKHHARIPDLCKLLFQEKYTNVRFFFDVILAEKSVPHIAVLYKNIDVLRQCTDLKIKDAGGRNALQVACSWGQRYPELKVVKSSAKYTIDQDSDLIIEEDVKFKQILEFLIKKLDVNAKDKIFKMDSFDYACNTQSIYAVLSIIENIWPTYLKKQEHFVVANTLYYAVRFGFSSILTTSGDTKVIEMRNGNTLLHVAAEHSQLKCVQTFLDQSKYRKCVNQKGKNGETPLHASARAGDYKIVQLLINSGGDINAKNDHNQTPLFCAAAKGRHHVVQLLLRLGADKSLLDKFGRSPLSYACENGFSGVIEAFCNTDFNVVDKTGWSPLFYAAKNGREDVVELLLVQHGAAVNITDKFGKSALGLACEYGHRKIAELLIQFRANVNIADEVVGWTPIFYAVKNGHEEVVELLLKSGARVDVQDKAENGPQNYNSNPEIMKLFSSN